MLIPILVAFQSFLYFFSKITPFKPHLMGSAFDSKIPFVPFFIYLYISWYLLLFLIPYIFYKKDKNKFYKFITCSFICAVISSLIYIFYPTTMLRTNIETTGITSFIINFIYIVDTPVINCLPSMHCVLCFLFMLCIPKNLKLMNKIIIIFISLMVILSTLFIKQHVIIDIISAFIISFSTYIIISKTRVYLKIFKEN